MIVTCDGCQTKYLLGDEKVPRKGIRVRCPKCRFVWRLMPQSQESVFELTSSGFASEIPMEEPAGTGWSAMEQPRAAVVTAVEEESLHEDIEMQETEPVAVEEPASVDPELRRKNDRARRLARVFVSDILVYNREKRDQGLANGDLMTILGPEIKKSWEAYKDKVGSDCTECSSYFREALNNILADGQKVF